MSMNHIRRRLIVKYKEEEKRIWEDRAKSNHGMNNRGVCKSKVERLAMFARWDREENIQARIEFLQSEIVKCV